MKVFADRNM